jgi:hypothetical protein
MDTCARDHLSLVETNRGAQNTTCEADQAERTKPARAVPAVPLAFVGSTVLVRS